MFNPWVGKVPWRRSGQTAPVFLPGESHGQRSVVGCGPWGRRESDTSELLNNKPQRPKVKRMLSLPAKWKKQRLQRCWNRFCNDTGFEKRF